MYRLMIAAETWQINRAENPMPAIINRLARLESKQSRIVAHLRAFSRTPAAGLVTKQLCSVRASDPWRLPRQQERLRIAAFSAQLERTKSLYHAPSGTCGFASIHKRS